MQDKKIVTFYKFAKLPDFVELKAPLLEKCRKNHIKGTILLAKEGINATICGSLEEINTILDYLKEDTRLKDLEVKESFEDSEKKIFSRMKVRLRKEIITFDPEIDPNEVCGQYVDANEWNQLLEDPDVTVVDTRNDYEVKIGTFKNAIDPHIKNFTDLKDYVSKNLDPKKDKKVAMFCTGGVRCEKSTAYLVKKGFNQVYHLKGGILKYLEEIPKEKSLWEGECFVFDYRVSVDHDLKRGKHELCMACGDPISEEDKISDKFIEGVQCPNCFDKKTDEQKEKYRARQKQIDIAKERNLPHPLL